MLLTFGDSFTQGIGLEQHITPNTAECSLHAWPAKAAEFLNIDFKNYGRAGSSIKEVAYTIYNRTFAPDDIVVIMWPVVMSRTCLIRNNELIKIGVWCLDNEERPDEKYLARHYYSDLHYSPEDIFFTSSLLMNSVDMYIKKFTVNVYHTNVRLSSGVLDYTTKMPLQSYTYLDLYNHKSCMLNPEFLELYDKSVNPLYAKDGLHYSIEQHTSFAEKLSRKIKI